MFKSKRSWLMLTAILLTGCISFGADTVRFYVKFSDYTDFINYMGSAPLNKEKAYMSIPSDLETFDLIDFQLMFIASSVRYPKNPSFRSPEHLYIKYRVDVANVESVTLQIQRTEKKDVVGANKFEKTKAKIKDYPTFGVYESIGPIYEPDYKVNYHVPDDPDRIPPIELMVRIDTTAETLEEKIQIKDQLFADIKASLVTYRV
jgi:hypothetical protein